MTLENTTVCCPCCGEKMELTIKTSTYIPNCGVDLKPTTKQGLPIINRCMHCNYVTDKKIEITSEKKEVVLSDSYKNIWEEDIPVMDKEYLSLVKLASTATETGEIYLNYCFALEMDDRLEDAKKIRQKAIEFLDIGLLEEFDYDIAIQVADSLRQLGRFSEAIKVLDKMVEYADEMIADEKEEAYEVDAFMRDLIEKKDTTPHMQSEIDDINA